MIYPNLHAFTGSETALSLTLALQQRHHHERAQHIRQLEDCRRIGWQTVAMATTDTGQVGDFYLSLNAILHFNPIND